MNPNVAELYEETGELASQIWIELARKACSASIQEIEALNQELKALLASLKGPSNDV